MNQKENLNRAKFGPRYGYTPVLNHLRILKGYSGRSTCPNCNYSKKLKRVSTGIWKCKKCGFKVVGSAYSTELNSI